MFSSKTVLVAGVLLLSGASTMAYATELGAESIVEEQGENQRALAEQAQYRAYHEHQKQLRAQRGDNSVLPPRRN